MLTRNMVKNHQLRRQRNSLSNKDIVKYVLQHFKQKGMWVVTETNSSFIIQLKKLTEDEYNEALDTLDDLDENGN